MSAMLDPTSGIAVGPAAWWGRLCRSARVRELRRFYATHLAEEAESLPERVHYHLDQLDEYWARCLSFLEFARPARASFLAHDFFVCVLIGSEAAGADIRAYAADYGVAPLAGAWDAYEVALRRARRGEAGIADGLAAAAEALARVRDLHADLEAGASSRPAV